MDLTRFRWTDWSVRPIPVPRPYFPRRTRSPMSKTPGAPTLKLVHGASIPADRPGHLADGGRARPRRPWRRRSRLGYRLVDTADDYGNEEGVGRGLRASGVPREELFVTTKFNGEWHGYDAAQEAFAASAERLGVDYVDLLPHPLAAARGRTATSTRGGAWPSCWRTAGSGRSACRTSSPPTSTGCSPRPAWSPTSTRSSSTRRVTRDAARAYHAAHGIVTQSWSPHRPGRRAAARTRWSPRSPSGHGRTPGAGRAALAHRARAWSAVPKSADPERMRANIDVFDFTLTPKRSRPSRPWTRARPPPPTPTASATEIVRQ